MQIPETEREREREGVCVYKREREGAEASNDSTPEMIFPSAPQRVEIVPDRIYGNGHKR